MPKANYIKSADLLFSQQLLTYKNNIGTYATVLGVTTEQMAAQAADADYLEYVLACLDVCNNCSQQWTAWKEILRNGGTVPVTGAPGGPDFSTFKPVLKLESSGGNVFVRWGWQGYAQFLDLIEIQVDRGAGYALLATDTTPNYLDTAPPPATAAKWTYKAIYRVGDQRVGQWSDEVSITVAA